MILAKAGFKYDFEENKAPQITEEEIVKDIQEKCYKAFIQFDQEGSGSQIKSDQVKDVLNAM